MEPIQLAAILVGAALVASIVSVEVGISVALVELALGVALGNAFNLDPNAGWLVFLSILVALLWMGAESAAARELGPRLKRGLFAIALGGGVVLSACGWALRLARG